LDSADDTQLMARVRVGDGEALALLFERHQGPLVGFLHRMTGSAGLAEDLAQESFLRVLRYARSFKPEAPFRPWLYRIARNVLADHRSPLDLPLEPHAASVPAAGPCPHAVLEATERRQRLAEALERLPEDKRELLLLSRNLGYEALAENFGCSAGALKVRVHRALQELRALFFEGQEVRP
jgi:RNA polymerase sigma-70 factor (ECF subfamily)